MKKIINVIKKISLMIGAFCISMYTKVFATLIPYETVTATCAYGVPTPQERILEISKILIIPIAILIGLIIYLKKSKGSKKKKVLVTISALAVVAAMIVYMIINN